MDHIDKANRFAQFAKTRAAIINARNELEQLRQWLQFDELAEHPGKGTRGGSVGVNITAGAGEAKSHAPVTITAGAAGESHAPVNITAGAGGALDGTKNTGPLTMGGASGPGDAAFEAAQLLDAAGNELARADQAVSSLYVQRWVECSPYSLPGDEVEKRIRERGDAFVATAMYRGRDLSTGTGGAFSDKPWAGRYCIVEGCRQDAEAEHGYCRAHALAEGYGTGGPIVLGNSGPTEKGQPK